MLAVRGRNSLLTTSLGSLSTACRPVSSQALATSGGRGRRRGEGTRGEERRGEKRGEEGRGREGEGREVQREWRRGDDCKGTGGEQGVGSEWKEGESKCDAV